MRNPNATRPWQHVLEPITGYLMLAEKMCSNTGDFFSGPWNFGPSSRQNMKVQQFAKIIKKELNSSSKILVKKNDKRFQNKKFKVFESKYLEIDSKKALKKLKWKPKLSIKEAVILTVEWYTSFKKRKNLLNLTKKQIENYLKK